eukprot:scaffold7296_cov70-Skeletonema_dohrnii-CCMP3373.AAC.3
MNNAVISLQQVGIMELELESNGFCTQQILFEWYNQTYKKVCVGETASHCNTLTEAGVNHLKSI